MLPGHVCCAQTLIKDTCRDATVCRKGTDHTGITLQRSAPTACDLHTQLQSSHRYLDRCTFGLSEIRRTLAQQEAVNLDTIKHEPGHDKTHGRCICGSEQVFGQAVEALPVMTPSRGSGFQGVSAQRALSHAVVAPLTGDNSVSSLAKHLCALKYCVLNIGIMRACPGHCSHRSSAAVRHRVPPIHRLLREIPVSMTPVYATHSSVHFHFKGLRRMS